MARVTDAELVGWIRRELAQAEGCGSGELAEVRKEALDRYYGRPRGDEKEGRSAVQSSDVADMVEAVIAQMLPGFSGDSVVEFEPVGAEDVEQAALESDVVNKVIIEANRGYTMFQEALRGALLLRNGWIKVELDERDEATTVKLRGVPAEGVTALLDQELAADVVSMALVGTTDVGDGMVDAEVRVTRKIARLVVRAVDPVNMSWKAGYDSVFLDDVPFLAEAWYPTRSDLVRMGYERAIVDELPACSAQWSVDQQARDQSGTPDRSSADSSMEVVEAYWVHYRYDSDNDGIAELHRICYAGGSKGAILDDEMVDFVPYATGTAFLQAHRLNGLGIYDKLRQTEDAKTSILRQWIDNLSVANNSRVAVNMRTVNIEDATDSRPGGIVRINGEVGPSMMPLPMSDVGGSAAMALEYQDKIRSERGGASLDLQTAQMQIAGDTAHGIERQMSSREQMAAMMSRTLAETLVRQTYILAHRGLRAWIDQPITARRAGEFVQSNPAEWVARDRVNVKTGLSVGERNARRVALEAVLGQQEKLAAAGYDGVLVTAQQYHAALLDWTRAAQIDNGNRYFQDPASKESQAAAKAKAEQSQQREGMQMQIASAAASGQAQAARIEQAMAKYKADQSTALEYWKAALEAEIEATKIGAQSAEAEALGAVGVMRSEAVA